MVILQNWVLEARLFHFSKDTTNNRKLYLATATLLKFPLNHTKIILSKYQNHSNWSQGLNTNQGSWEVLLFITFHFFKPQWSIIWQVGESLTGQHALLWLLWFLSHRLHYLVYCITVNYKGNCCLTPLISQICQGEKKAPIILWQIIDQKSWVSPRRAIDYLCITWFYHTPEGLVYQFKIQNQQMHTNSSGALWNIPVTVYNGKEELGLWPYAERQSKRAKYLH